MSQLSTYRAKGKTIGLVFLFKYDLNGNLRLFEIVEGELTNEQMIWLYSGNFPATETIMKTIWQKAKKYTAVFEIEKAAADLSFEALWNLYDNKVKRMESEKQFNKAKEADIVKMFLSVPDYKDYVTRKKINQAHLSTFINQRYFEDDFKKV